MQNTTKRIKLRKRGQRGAALLLTLVAITVASLSAATVATLVAAHNSRASTDQSSMKALYAADAAMNYQAQRIYTNMGNNQVGYNGSNVEAATYGFAANAIPVGAKSYSTTTGGTSAGTLNNFLGLASSDTAKCWTQYANDPTGTRQLDMTSTDPLYIYGSATVNGVTRTVRVTATGKALFSTWGVFTNGSLSVGGTLAATPAAGTTSTLVGSNSAITVASHTSSGITQATYGSRSSGDSCAPCTHSSCSVHLPSVDQLANSCASGHSGCDGNGSNGICQFASSNDNCTCAKCCDDVTPLAAMPTSGVCPKTGSCQMYLTGKSGGTNIYLPSLSCSNLKIWANVSNGPVNVWVNNTCSANNPNCKDKVDGNCDICPYHSWDTCNNRPATTTADCSKLHIYYSNQCGSLNLHCNGTTKNVCGQIYAYNTFNGTPCGSVHIGTSNHSGGYGGGSGSGNGSGIPTTNTTITGQIYSQSLTTTGSLTVNSPPVAQTTDGAGMMFSASTSWQEVSPIYGN